MGRSGAKKIIGTILWIFTLGAVLLAGLSVLEAQAPLKKMTAGISTLGGSTAIIYVTQKAGLFERHGLDVQIVYFGSGAIAASGLLSGEAKITLMSASSTLAAAIGGADVVQIGGLVHKLAYGLMVAPPITNFRDLKGHSVGIAGFGGASDFAANHIIRKEDLAPGKDVHILSVGGQAERLSALSSGKVKAVLLEPPFTGRAEKLGFRKLVDFPSLDLEFQTMGLVTSRSHLKSERKTYLDFVKAITEGIHFFKSRKKESTAILASILKTQDRDALEEMHDLYARHLMPEVPYSSIKGMQNALELLALRNPKAKGKDPMDTVDDSLVKEMEEEGFITYLRKTYSSGQQK